MTDRENEERDDLTRVDQQPPVFPRVGGPPAADDETRLHQTAEPIFSGPRQDPPVSYQPPLTRAPVFRSSAQARWRWAIVALATIAVVAVVGGLFLLGGPRAGAPSTSALYAPADTVAYAEMRFDLPGDQRQRLAAFMSHFPGFADPATFEQKLDDTLNQLMISTGMGLDWHNDVDPWFGGQLAVFSSTINPTPGTPPSMTIVLTVRDRGRLDTLVEQRLTGTDVSQEDHHGQAIRTVIGGPDHQRLSFVMTDEVLLVGMRVEDVRSALDVRADREAGLADDPYYLQQLAGLHADQLATVYFDGRPVTGSLGGHLGDELPAMGALDFLFDASAMRIVGELRAESDHLSLTARTERAATADLPPLPANKTTTLAEMAPADSLAYAEFRQVGQSVGFAIERVLEPLASGEGGGLGVNMFQQLLGTPPQDFLDFVDDVAVAVGYGGDQPEAGLIAAVNDEAIARQRLERALGAIRSVAAFVGGLTVDEQTHGDATITVISLGLLGDSLGSVSATVSGGRMLIGLDDFVVQALDRTAADSLAARPEYQSALAAGGASNAGLMFADIAALRELAEGFVPAAERAAYDLEKRPFVAPLSHLSIIHRTDGLVTVSHVLLYVE